MRHDSWAEQAGAAEMVSGTGGVRGGAGGNGSWAMWRLLRVRSEIQRQVIIGSGWSPCKRRENAG